MNIGLEEANRGNSVEAPGFSHEVLHFKGSEALESTDPSVFSRNLFPISTDTSQ